MNQWDFKGWEKMPLSVSIIIPVYHEADIIVPMISALKGLNGNPGVEIIVVDGDPDGSTIRDVRDACVKTLLAGKGRASQMNRGAAAAKGDILLFLHADTCLPPNALQHILEIFRDRRIIGGSFDLGIQSEKKAYRLIEKMVYYRTRLTKMPYGDQAIFIFRKCFLKLGGFKEIPIMEDIELMRRIKAQRYRIGVIPHPVRTDPRRWEKEGIIYCTLRNWTLAVLFLLGVSPEKLAGYYRPL
jgi:rSAM/selenodomain-associated transferase 2